MHIYMYTRSMAVEWDPEKAAADLRTHGVDFADAVGVFEDVHALSREDPQAHGKQRFVAVGMDFLGRCSPSSILPWEPHPPHFGAPSAQARASHI
jgi:Ribonuclease toxin, BrnT, of type II toxin-antitoxin system